MITRNQEYNKYNEKDNDMTCVKMFNGPCCIQCPMGDVNHDQVIAWDWLKEYSVTIMREGSKSARLPCQCLISLLVFSEN